MSEHRYFETVAVKAVGGKGITVQLVDAKSHQDEDYRKKGFAPLIHGGVTVYFDLSILFQGKVELPEEEKAVPAEEEKSDHVVVRVLNDRTKK
jgi:hypothetical protein